MTSLTLTIPLIPPSVNHYKVKTRRGSTYVTDEAKAFKEAIAIVAAGRRVGERVGKGKEKQRYELEASVFLGYKQKGDGDNFWKCLADGLKEAGVIHSDAAVTDWIMRVRRDRENPRTEITVRAKA